MPDKRIENEYEKAFSQLGEIQPFFPVNAKAEMAKMVEEIFRRDENLKNILKTTYFKDVKKDLAVKAGKAAEEFHTEMFNYDAISKNKNLRAITDKYKQEWSEAGFTQNDKVADMAVLKDGKAIHTVQSKYWKNAKETAKEMRKPQYSEADSFVGPSDQAHPTDGSRSIAEEAHRTALKNRETRPNVARTAENVEKKVADSLDVEGVASKPLTKNDAEKIAKNPDSEIRKNVHDERQTASTLKHMRQAAVGAAAISAVASGVFNTFVYCKMVKEGKITESEAVIKIAAETACSAADSAIKASASVGLQSTLVRYSTKEGIKLIANNSVRSLLRTNVATVGVICGIDVIKDLVRLGIGKIDKRQFEERNGKNLLNTSAGMMGGSVGFKVASSFALSGKVATAATLTGGIAGGLIAGLAMQFAIENHIEKPYKELVSNTVALTESMQMFQQVSENIFKGQVIFAAFLEKERQLDAEFGNQVKRIQAAGDRMRKAIDRL